MLPPAHAVRPLLWALALALFFPAPQGFAQGRPFTLEDLVEIVRSGAIAESRIIRLVGDRCVAFAATEANLARLRDAGAKASVTSAVRRACRVLPGEPRWVALGPPSVDVVVGKPVPLTATALAPDSSEIPQALLRWTSSDSAVVEVRPDGSLAARAPGLAYVTAIGTNDVRSDAATVIVRSPPVARKSTTTAILVGTLVPGGGQFYTGQSLKGALLFAASVATTAIGFAVTSNEVSLTDPQPPECAVGCTFVVTFEKKRPAIVPTLIAAGGLWLYGVFDASQTARATHVSSRRLKVELLGEATFSRDGTVDLPFMRILF